jgi:hypothetical protein
LRGAAFWRHGRHRQRRTCCAGVRVPGGTECRPERLADIQSDKRAGKTVQAGLQRRGLLAGTLPIRGLLEQFTTDDQQIVEIDRGSDAVEHRH